jgi:hypothetical protein
MISKIQINIESSKTIRESRRRENISNSEARSNRSNSVKPVGFYKIPGIYGRSFKMNASENSLNYKQAKASSRWRDYKASMHDFIGKLEDHNGFMVVDKPRDANIIGSRWVFVDKFDASGNFIKAKARLTPLGYQQKKGVDYQETFAPVVMMPSSRFLHILALKWGRSVKSFDVENAFQITKLRDEQVYMEIPEGFEEHYGVFDRNKQCLLLQNAINGLKQSGNEFYKKLNSVMRELGFKNLKSDQCVYFKVKYGKMIIVGVHVDDAKFIAETDELENDFIANFNAKLKTSGSGKCEEFLKTRIVQEKDFVSFDQTTKILNYCKEFQIKLLQRISD